ncbi:MAG: FAD-dependent oxidoreductase [Cyanobacteria bacterium]|nr:FAD-dependent oxidoreductase [Cyanobacteriota bacterium]
MTTSQPRVYDLIVYGDEVPGVLALVAAAREVYRRQRRYPRTLLMLKGLSTDGIGGHLVRGRLAYLDRSHVSPALRQQHGLATFGEPAALYREFLERSGVVSIGLDWQKAGAALRQMLAEVSADLVSLVNIATVRKNPADGTLREIVLERGEVYAARQFIDATVNAELATAAQVPKVDGFGTMGLPNATLPVTLTFETEGLTVTRLRQIEASYIKRLTDVKDKAAQSYLMMAAGQDASLAKLWRSQMVDANGNPRTMVVGQDFIDVRCRALSVFYHASRGKRMDLQASGAVLDVPNIALLPGGRLSWNALLCHVDGAEANALARNGARPSPRILTEMEVVGRWGRAIGATAVTPAKELYIRYAGNITDAIAPLSGAQMLAGGVPEPEALGSFGYHFDVRGGIAGLGDRATARGYRETLQFALPVFNYGIGHAQVKSVPNLAVVSPASAYVGVAGAAGRIVELNVGVGQGIGIAAAIALVDNRPLKGVTNREVRQVLSTTGRLPKRFGRADGDQARLQRFEQAVVPRELYA